MIINLSHGNGGKETSSLIDNIFMKYFKNDLSAPMADAAVLRVEGEAPGGIAFTTDSFVVQPLFFKGGDIGRLAICGTVNDLLTAGALPKYISAGFIIEEGVDTAMLDKIADSMQKTAMEAGVKIVTGDTKVIEGNGGIYINTSGIGYIKQKAVSFSEISEGDAILVSGTMGDHHACIMSHRMNIENNIMSDVAPLNDIVMNLISSEITIKGIRDITRGGLATVLNEVANANAMRADIYEQKIPVSTQVDGLCKILGLDPLYMGNEGKFLVAVAKEDAERALDIIKKSSYGENASIIGQFATGIGVHAITSLGVERVINPLQGESLPRVC